MVEVGVHERSRRPVASLVLGLALALGLAVPGAARTPEPLAGGSPPPPDNATSVPTGGRLLPGTALTPDGDPFAVTVAMASGEEDGDDWWTPFEVTRDGSFAAEVPEWATSASLRIESETLADEPDGGCAGLWAWVIDTQVPLADDGSGGIAAVALVAAREERGETCAPTEAPTAQPTPGEPVAGPSLPGTVLGEDGAPFEIDHASITIRTAGAEWFSFIDVAADGSFLAPTVERSEEALISVRGLPTREEDDGDCVVLIGPALETTVPLVRGSGGLKRVDLVAREQELDRACLTEGTPTPSATPVVTEAPQESPTAVPTEEPTAKPTEEPTAKPTEEPTAKPTEEPAGTEEPAETAEPTDAWRTEQPVGTERATATTPSATPTPSATQVASETQTAAPDDTETAGPAVTDPPDETDTAGGGGATPTPSVTPPPTDMQLLSRVSDTPVPLVILLGALALLIVRLAPRPRPLP